MYSPVTVICMTALLSNAVLGLAVPDPSLQTYTSISGSSLVARDVEHHHKHKQPVSSVSLGHPHGPSEPELPKENSHTTTNHHESRMFQTFSPYIWPEQSAYVWTQPHPQHTSDVQSEHLAQRAPNEDHIDCEKHPHDCYASDSSSQTTRSGLDKKTVIPAAAAVIAKATPSPAVPSSDDTSTTDEETAGTRLNAASINVDDHSPGPSSEHSTYVLDDDDDDDDDHSSLVKRNATSETDGTDTVFQDSHDLFDFFTANHAILAANGGKGADHGYCKDWRTLHSCVNIQMTRKPPDWNVCRKASGCLPHHHNVQGYYGYWLLYLHGKTIPIPDTKIH